MFNPGGSVLPLIRFTMEYNTDTRELLKAIKVDLYGRRGFKKSLKDKSILVYESGGVSTKVITGSVLKIDTETDLLYLQTDAERIAEDRITRIGVICIAETIGGIINSKITL